jgi:hypothetical protein
MPLAAFESAIPARESPHNHDANPAATGIRLTLCLHIHAHCEDGGCSYPRTSSKLLPHYMVLEPRMQNSSYSPRKPASSTHVSHNAVRSSSVQFKDEPQNAKSAMTCTLQQPQHTNSDTATDYRQYSHVLRQVYSTTHNGLCHLPL